MVNALIDKGILNESYRFAESYTPPPSKIVYKDVLRNRTAEEYYKRKHILSPITGETFYPEEINERPLYFLIEKGIDLTKQHGEII